MLKNLLMKRPFLVVFDVTKRCNSKCNMCSLWQNPSDPKKELSLNQIKKIFSDLKDFGIEQVLIQGGEPLLRKDIFEIIELLINLGLKPSLITNGLLLTKQNVLKLAKLNCNVTISFDTLKRSRYKKIRGIDAFNLVKQNILFASKVKRRRGDWYLNATFSELNYDECLKVYDFAVSNGFGFFAFPYNYSICKASAKDDELVFKNQSKIIKAFEKLIKKSIELGDVVNELTFKEVIKYLRGGYHAPCDALNYSLMVDERGLVSPCIELSHEFNLINKSISEVWPLFNRDRVKNCYLKTPCFYGCTRSAGLLVRGWFQLINFGLKNPSKINQLFKSIH